MNTQAYVFVENKKNSSTVCFPAHQVPSEKWFRGVNSLLLEGVVGYGKRVVHLISPGHPADIGLQLGKACYPCSR